MRESNSAGAAAFRRLKPGPGMTHDEVVAHQHRRISRALIELVAERGYDAITVGDIVSLAGVSKPTFYQQFGNKDECFLSTYDSIVNCTARRVLTSQALEDDYRQMLRSRLGTLAAEVANDPQAARLVLVDAFAAGPEALERMKRTGRLFEALLRDSLIRSPEGVAVPSLVLKGIVAGIARVLSSRLLAGREGELPELVDELVEWALCVRGEAAIGPLQVDLSREAPSTAVTPETLGLQDRGGDVSLSFDERAVILSAAAKIATAEGFWRLTVPRIRGTAGVSRRSFDNHFKGVSDCFFALLASQMNSALAEAARVQALATDWTEGIQRAVASICDHISSDPSFAQLGFIEVLAPGRAGVEWRARLMERIDEFVFTTAPSGHGPSRLAAEASVGAIWGIVHYHIYSAQTQRLPEVADLLSLLILAPASNAQVGSEAVRAGPSRGGDGTNAGPVKRDAVGAH